MAKAHYSTPEAFTAQRSIGYLVRRAAKLVSVRAERLFEGRELTLTQWIALAMVGEELAVTPSAVACHLGHNTGATTRMLDQLEDGGLLTRARETEDRRVVTLGLTDDGETALATLRPLMADNWNEALEGFDDTEIETLTNLLIRLVARLDHLRE
jgi:DNA-binding MarR family transcriptional regulator